MSAPLDFPKEVCLRMLKLPSGMEVPLTNGLLPPSTACPKCAMSIVFPQQPIQTNQSDDEEKLADAFRPSASG